MNWSNVKLIFLREVRDQLRDRRTLFMIAVLPILLYPLLGMSMFQMAQFLREQSTRVIVVGAPELSDGPELFEDDRFALRLYRDSERRNLSQLTFLRPDATVVGPPAETSAELLKRAQAELAATSTDAVLYFPPDFDARLAALRARLNDRTKEAGPQPEAIPPAEVYFNSANEKSQIAASRVSQALERWRDELGRQNLAKSGLPESAAKPFDVKDADIAAAGHRDAAVWSKVLPFLLLIWALTGAFYPAVDLCAGEKERGTLETLLSSPAERSEIVWGKLLTIMLFSMATAGLNLLSMGVTGSLLMSQLPMLGAPPPLAPLWLAIALLPVAALFSALCLALAAFARSTKEGQYYLMPLVLVTLPLVVLPMAPGVDLTLGNSLIPLTGVVLLLRAMLEGNYWQALLHGPPVVLVTLVCCLLAIRWAVDQFNRESVLFRESERLDLGLWIRQLVRDREDTPTVSAAIFCGMVILLLRFFMSFAMPHPSSFVDLAKVALVTQLAVVAMPALVMTIMLTRSPARTLLLRWPESPTAPLVVLSWAAAAILAVTLHPVVSWLNVMVTRLYPVSSDIQEALGAVLKDHPPLWQLLLVIALAPAICEELAFRGFILSGLRHVGSKWRAIALSSVFFGVTHGILQQSISATLVGLVIGYLAIQTGSLVTCIVFHACHNALMIGVTMLSPDVVEGNFVLRWIVQKQTDGSYFCDWPAVLVGGVAALGILYFFSRLSYERTPEESLQEEIDRQAAAELAHREAETIARTELAIEVAPERATR